MPLVALLIGSNDNINNTTKMNIHDCAAKYRGLTFCSFSLLSGQAVLSDKLSIKEPRN